MRGMARGMVVALLGICLCFFTQQAIAATVHVQVVNFSFSPPQVTINLGDTVQWDWAGGNHSSTSGSCTTSLCTANGIWDSTILSSGSFSHTFNSVGTFSYFCIPHGISFTMQ